MGSGHTKDGFIDIFLQTTQPIYVTGSYVQGTVYINCKDSRNYNALNVKLSGVEHVHWSEGSGKHRRHYSNTKNTYQSSFQLALFPQGVVPGGHYAFPFRFVLPSELSGSYFESQNHYIRYPLTAELISSDGKNDNQIYTKYLNILEPARELSGMIQKQQFSTPQCCGCCANYGVVKVVMSCDKNFVRSGDIINVTGVIDNSGGKQDLTNCHVSFKDMRWKISSSGAVRNHTLFENKLFTIPQPVGKGQTRKFSFTATIPHGLMFSTAIGSILSRYQVLSFMGEMGCCSGGATCQFLLVFHSGTQQIEVSPKVPSPPGWMPKVANEVLCTNLPPFHYQPNPSIPYLNRAGTTNITNLTAMNTMTTQQPYLPNNSQQQNTFTNMPQLY